MTAEPTQLRPTPRIGLALGGGGPLGGIYEIGALRALDEALDGLDFNDLDVYVGVNAGSFVAANLANQLTTAQLCRIFVRHEAEVHPFHPEVFYRPAVKEMGRRLRAVPGLLSSAVSRFLRNPHDQSFLEAMTILAQAAPAGLFDNSALEEYLARAFTTSGRTNDFRKLRRRLFVIAADVETAESVCFGGEHLDHIPVSRAIQASMASPGLYTPVQVEGRYCVDGTLHKGLHASVALDHGAELVLAINPQVPVDARAAEAAGTMAADELTGSGMPNLLSQMYRTMVHSRIQKGLAQYDRDYPGREVILIEPTRDDATLFFSSAFSFRSRRQVCEHAYQMTRRDLLRRADELEPILARHGVRLNRKVLEDSERTISTALYGETLPLYVAKKRKQRQKKGVLGSVSQVFSKAL
ncbi:patatin-like phospholipase family protein [Marinobacter zhanjiangensis]|uniref:Patatin n=1 Tax=Marinobacter zhanjiangensis TaxID=578215 RepID=A0ABQ3B8Z1_9GAMM|nr:patatin-like phospholipase family protein [Marinobacter zhanjiangensis]GGY79210.1 patatin [Marinobacter zhanjiangensis]